MKKAFTLIELLVVIAIIAILAAILFPVFAQAKAAAKKTSALSNIKQTSTGVLIYMGDQEGNYPIGSGTEWFYPQDGGWAWDTQPYIKSLPILRDTSDPMKKTYWQDWFKTDPNAVSISFAANSAIKWNGSDNEVVGLINMLQGKDRNGIPTRSNPGGWNGGWYSGSSIVSETGVSRPADTIMFASRYGGNNYYGGGAIISGITGWDFMGPQALPDGTRDGTPYTVTVGTTTDTVNKNNRFGAVAAPYTDTGLFVFADSHAKAMNPARTNPKPMNENELDVDNMWNAKRP
ncbi:prepilin-type N-terminal cleavage/methylation domain-containing protein [bacterium]|nr:MAG: prepilin-type N-terminal cleavage/methylation domain-containing protein [bacterium]